jgi:Spy/CpxP family protein refolding chaperone
MTKFVVILGFFVAFAAGLIVGIESRQTSGAATSIPPAPTTVPGARAMRRAGFLPTELNLTPQQQEAMKKIWSDGGGVSRAREEQQEKRAALRRQRDEAIAAMLGPTEKATYDEIQKKYQDQVQALDREMRAGFEAKVKQTNELLTPEQRTKYEEILKRHQWDRGGDRGSGRGGDRGGSRGEGSGAPPPGGTPARERDNSRGPDAGATSRPAS